MSTRLNPPLELIDPDGEGVYLYEDQSSVGVLFRAAQILLGTGAEWREIEHRTVFMEPDPTSTEGCWRETSSGRFPRDWKGLLPRRWRPVVYIYCTPKPDSANQGEK